MKSRTTWVVLGAAVAVDVLARAALHLGFAGADERDVQLSSEVRWMLFASLTLVLLLRVVQRRPLLRVDGQWSVALIVFLSSLYLQLIGAAVLAVPALVRGSGLEGTLQSTLGSICSLGGLAACLALTSLDARASTLTFALLAWGVPVLGFPEPLASISSTKAATHAPWSVDGILAMLVPQLLALGLVCLERWRR